MNSTESRWFHSYDFALRHARALAVFDLFAKRHDGSYHYWAQHLPNFLCYLRIVSGLVLVPLLGWALWHGQNGLAWRLLATIFILILTDLIDGPLARHMQLDLLPRPVGRWNGGSLDATADKCLMIPMFLMTAIIMIRHNPHLLGFAYFGIAVAVLICDGFLIYVTVQEANLAAEIGRTDDLGPHAGQAGKWKIHAQAAGVILATGSVLGHFSLAGADAAWAAIAFLMASIGLCLVSFRGHLANFRRIAVAAGAPKMNA